MKKSSDSKLQQKRFFASLCYANQCISLFERQLIELPEKDWPTVLLASIIIDNSGLANVREDAIQILTASQDTVDESKQTNTTGYTSETKKDGVNAACNEEVWVEIPNQYIIQNRAWLHPVIRACDPEKSTFTEEDYGTRLLENLSENLGIRLKSKEDMVLFELKHSLEVIVQLVADPNSIGVSQEEIDNVIATALTDKGLRAVKARTLMGNDNCYSIVEKDELSKGLIFLVTLTFLFAATGFVCGFYCSSGGSAFAADRDLIRMIH